LVESVDKTWGDLGPNGTITGLIGMASRSEVHMSITGITMTGNPAKILTVS